MRAFILVVLTLLLGISGNRQLANQFSTANMSQTLQVALAQGTMIENIDTHGGFHGDGQSLTVWKFDDNSILEQSGIEWNKAEVNRIKQNNIEQNVTKQNGIERTGTISSNVVKIENEVEQSVLDEVCAF
mgnify:CR=1 FL=1